MATKRLKTKTGLLKVDLDTSEKSEDKYGEVTKKEPYYWDEISQEKKIERLREQVKRQSKCIDNLSKQIRKFERHIHGQDGELLIPYKNSEGYGENAEKSTGSFGVYF